MQVYTFPYSTNAERVSLALGHKGIAVEWVQVDPADRAPVREVSGQDLVPVLVEEDGSVTHDSPAILARLEVIQPEPALYPRDPGDRARVEVFIDWFNRVWKVPPNAIADDDGRATREQLDGWARELEASRDRFEALLTGRDHLLGDKFSVADVIAQPFLRYAVDRDPADTHPFHETLRKHLDLGDGYPNLAAWIGRVAQRPYA